MTVRIVHDLEGGHSYLDGDTPVPGVTTILKPLSEHLYRAVPVEVLMRAAILGRAVHQMIHFDCKGTLDEDSIEGELAQYLYDWRQFRDTSGFVPILSEQVVHSSKFGYAGQLDLYGELNGEPTLIDTKRVAKVMPTTGPQTAAYANALTEMGYPCRRRYALHLHGIGNTRWRLQQFTDPGDLRVFLSCLNIHNFIKANP